MKSTKPVTRRQKTWPGFPTLPLPSSVVSSASQLIWALVSSSVLWDGCTKSLLGLWYIINRPTIISRPAVIKRFNCTHHFTASRWGNNGNSDRLFICWGSQITADGNYSLEIKRRLLLGRKAMTNLDNILKSTDMTLSTKVHLVKAMVFPFSNGPHFVRTPHHDPSILGGPTRHGS